MYKQCKISKELENNFNDIITQYVIENDIIENEFFINIIDKLTPKYIIEYTYDLFHDRDTRNIGEYAIKNNYIKEDNKIELNNICENYQYLRYMNDDDDDDDDIIDYPYSECLSDVLCDYIQKNYDFIIELFLSLYTTPILK